MNPVQEKLSQTISKAKSDDNGFGLEIISFKGKHHNYEVSFYANQENGHELEVEDFGRMYKGEWEQLNPTQNQIDQMQKIISDHKKYLIDQEDEEAIREAEREIEAQEWEGTKDFINSNFYTHY